MVCQACQRDSHHDCSAQINQADMPCDCEHCWGLGGSTRIYNDLQEINRTQKRRYDEKKQYSNYPDPV